MAAPDCGGHRGPKRKIADWQLQLGLIMHLLQPLGSLAQSIRQHWRLSLSDAALSLRRQKMKQQPFLTLMRHALRPLAVAADHPRCFFKGLRLVGHDGTPLSVANTPAVLAGMSQAGVMRISFGWCVQLTTALWRLLASGQDLLDEATQAELVRRTRAQIAQFALPKRRSRTCARKVRQPVCKWPRLFYPLSVTSEPQLLVLPIT